MGEEKMGLKIKYLDNVMQKIAEGICSCQYLDTINKKLGSEKKKLACHTAEICLA